MINLSDMSGCMILLAGPLGGSGGAHSVRTALWPTCAGGIAGLVIGVAVFCGAARFHEYLMRETTRAGRAATWLVLAMLASGVSVFGTLALTFWVGRCIARALS